MPIEQSVWITQVQNPEYNNMALFHSLDINLLPTMSRLTSTSIIASLTQILQSNKSISTQSIKFQQIKQQWQSSQIFHNRAIFSHVFLFLLRWENSLVFIELLREENSELFGECVEGVFVKEGLIVEQEREPGSDEARDDSAVDHEPVLDGESLGSETLHDAAVNLSHEAALHEQAASDQTLHTHTILVPESIALWNAVVTYNLGDTRQRHALLMRKTTPTPTILTIRLADELIGREFYPFAQTNLRHNVDLFLTNHGAPLDEMQATRTGILYYMHDTLQLLHQWSTHMKRPYMYTYALQALTQRLKDALDLIYSNRSQRQEILPLALSNIHQLWASYGPYLVENAIFLPLPFKKSQTVNFLSALLQEIALIEQERVQLNAPKSSTQHDQLNGRTFYCAMCFALLYSKLTTKKRQQAIEKLTPTIFESVSLSVQSSTVDTQSRYLCIYILRDAMVNSEAIRSNFQQMITSMLNLLSSEEETSIASVCLLGEYFQQHPSELPQLFSRLESKSANERRNAIAVIHELFAIHQHIPKEIRQLLAHELLQRLHDDDLIVRSKTQLLFHHLEPEHIVRELMSRVSHRDEKVRSAAAQSLKNLLVKHEHPEQILSAMISILVEKSRISTNDDNQTNSQSTNPSPSPQNPMITAVLSSLVDFKISIHSEHHLPQMLDCAHRYFSLHPDSSDIIKIMKSLHTHPQIGRHFETIVQRARSMLEQNQSIAPSTPEEYVRQIAPYFMLISISTSEFTADNYPLFSGLITQGVQSTDAKIRQLSGDLLSRFPPHTYHQELLHRVGQHIQNGNFRAINVFLFVVFQSLQQYPAESATYIASFVQMLDDILSLPCPPEAVDLRNCQQGAFSCYSNLIRNEITQNVQHSFKTVRHVFGILRDAEYHLSQRICMVNALVMCAKNLNAHEMSQFADCCLHLCMDLIKDEKQGLPIRTSLVHILLVMAAQLKSGVHPYSFDLISTLQYCLRSRVAEMRKSGVKLFSALLVARDDLVVEYEHEFQEIFESIKSIGLIEEDAETRLLADKFVKLLKL